MSGKFITFEGGEGSGKSTQVAMLAASCKKYGIPYIVTREPGGTKGAEEIRDLLVKGDADRWDAVTETLLFIAARNDHVNRVIKPALEKGKWVLCDRFIDSTIVYQGIAKGVNRAWIEKLHRLVLGRFNPHLTFLLDIPPETGLARTQSRSHKEDRFERMDVKFHTNLRKGFLLLAKKYPKRIVKIDAAKDTQTIHRKLVAELKARYNVVL